ncbi:MAG: DUF1566 domain-containing protein [Campylobacterota bacterium]|nr:DUF1566 domain-containing protein [Campylobacterota bacterium]
MSQELQWGGSSKIGITKKNIDLIIKGYVKENYPLKVEKYHNDLKVQKEEKLKKFLNVVFISGDLMWQDNKDNKDLKMSKLEAKIYCKKLNLATKKDWRLPKYDELLTLVNYFRYKPAVIDEINHIVENRYWTASENSSDVGATWYVDFKFGETGSALRYLKYNVRCVREISEIEGEF